MFVAAIDLVDMIDAGCSLGRHSRDKHRYTRADIRRSHVIMLELPHVIVTDYHSAVRVAQNNLRPHIEEFIYEEQPTLEHLLMNQYRTLSLRGYHQQHRQQIGRQSRPRCVGYRQYRSVEERLDLIMLLRRDQDIIAIYVDSDSESSEGIRNNTQVAIRHIAYSQLRTRDRRHADKRTHLNHVGQQSVLCSVQFAYALNGQQIRTYAADLRSHPIEQTT